MLSRFIQIRSGERRDAVVAFLLLFGTLAGHTLLETARDALFLARLSASELPWVYLAIALVALVVSRLRLPARRARDGRWWLSMWLAIAAGITLLFWIVDPSSADGLVYALYVWSGLFATLSVVHFWLYLGRIYTVTQAKRLFGFVGAGSVLGALTGALAASWLAVAFDAQFLLLGAATAFLMTALLPWCFGAHPRAAPAGTKQRQLERGSVLSGLRLIRNHAYLRRVGALVLLATVAFTLVDFVFKSVVDAVVPAAELGSFFARFNVVLNGGALVVQLGLVSWLLRVLGVHRALWVLPVLLAMGSIGVVAGGGLIAVLFLKGADGALRHSLYRTSTELLFVPVSDGLRGRAKPVIDVLGQRGGQAFASLVILAAVAVRIDVSWLAVGIIGLAIGWVVLAGDLHRYYLDLFRATLREGAIETRVGLRNLDLGALETLFAALNSPDDQEVLGAIDLLAHQRRANLIPALILYHPSSAVVLEALDVFVEAGRTDFLATAERLSGHVDPEVRAAVLRAHSQLAPDEQTLRAALDDPSALVRATALVGLVSGGWMRGAEAEQALDELLEDTSAGAKAALAQAIRWQPSGRFARTLLRLADVDDPRARAEVAQAMGAVGDAAFIEPLIAMLEERELRPAAREALASLGAPALEALDHALGDESLEAHLRHHLPRTVSRFEPQAAADVLVRHLGTTTDGTVRYKILRGLGRIHADHAEVEMDRDALRTASERTLEAVYRLLDWRLALTRGPERQPERRTDGHELLVELLADKEQQTLERLFRLLGLLYPSEDFERIYRGVSGHRNARSSARELLEFLLEPPMRDPVLALIDDLSENEVLDQGLPYWTPTRAGYEQVLRALLGSSSQSLRCLAAHHAGELKVFGLKDRLEELAAQRDGYLKKVAESALGMLESTNPGEAESAESEPSHVT